MMLKNWVGLIIATAVLVTACHSPVYNQTEANVADVKLKNAELRRKFDNEAKTKPPLVVNKGLYVDRTPISLEESPSWLKNYVIIRGDQLPFSYYSRTIAKGANSNVLVKYQIGLDPAQKVSLNYVGSVKGAMDLLASKTGYVYTVHCNNIYWQAFITKTFDIAFMPGSSDYLMGKTSSGSGTASTSQQGGVGSGNSVSNYVSSDSSDSEFSNLKGTLSVWKDVEATVRQLLSPDGKVTVSESTTSVTVRDRPPNVELIGQYIHNLNAKLSKQVLIKIQIFEVNLENSYDFGIDWQVVTKAFHNSKFVINGNYGTPLSITALTPQPTGQSLPQLGTQIINSNVIPGYQILFNALNQQGKTSIVSEPRVLCLNNQVSVVRIVRSEGYAASVQNTTLSGTSGSSNLGTVTSQITPGTVITGLTLYVLPKIMGDRVYLQVNADLSTNDQFKTFGPTGANNPNSASIQLPNITEKHFNQRSMIRSGDSLILSGFRQLTNSANANQFLTSQALGGKASSEFNRETIVLITPYILNGSA